MSNAEYTDIEGELLLYEQGRTLRTLVNSPAWEIVIDTINAYRDSARKQLMDLAPGDPTVPTAHAAAAALDDFATKFPQDVDKAVQTAAHPSAELTQYILEFREASDVLKTMGRGE